MSQSAWIFLHLMILEQQTQAAIVKNLILKTISCAIYGQLPLTV